MTNLMIMICWVIDKLAVCKEKTKQNKTMNLVYCVNSSICTVQIDDTFPPFPSPLFSSSAVVQ